MLNSACMSADKIIAQAVSDGVDSSAQTVLLSLVSLAEDASSSAFGLLTAPVICRHFW